MTDMAVGPNNTAPSPTPVGCEQLPVTEGIFNADSTNAKAPHMASSVRFLVEALIFFLMANTPATRNGIQSAPQLMHQTGARYPSIMCMAFALKGNSRKRLIAAARQTAILLRLTLFIFKTPNNLIIFAKKIKPLCSLRKGFYL